MPNKTKIGHMLVVKCHACFAQHYARVTNPSLYAYGTAKVSHILGILAYDASNTGSSPSAPILIPDPYMYCSFPVLCVTTLAFSPYLERSNTETKGLGLLHAFDVGW